MEAVASAEYYPNLASRHRDAPLWTVRYHPELTERLLPNVEADLDWPDDPPHRDFGDVTADWRFANFVRLAGAE